jgi:K+-transporting ATPase c subunit
VITPIRGTAPAVPVVPADAVTASGSGLDPPHQPRIRAAAVSTCSEGARDAYCRA